MKKLPVARSADIVVQEFDREILIYDLITNKIHSLSPTLSLVYRHCDGKTTLTELKCKYQFTDELIFLALVQLTENNLIETGNLFVSTFTGMSRRAAIRKIGLGSVIAIPLISSLAVPSAADAQSGVVGTCTPGPGSGTVGLGGGCTCTDPTPAGTICSPTNAVPCKAGCVCESTGSCLPGVSCVGMCI